MDIKLYILIKINGETKLRAIACYKVWADLGGIVGVFELESIDTVNRMSQKLQRKKVCSSVGNALAKASEG